MSRISWPRTAGCLAATAALFGSLFTGTAAAAPTVPSDPVVITNLAHSNYLIPDNCSGVPNTYLQVYYNGPDHPCLRTFTFEPVETRHGETVYQIRTAPADADRKKSCAEVSGKKKDDTNVLMRSCDANDKDQWFYLTDYNNGRNWAIVPYNNEGLALTALYGADNVARLWQRPGDTHATDSQLWYFTPADQM